MVVEVPDGPYTRYLVKEERGSSMNRGDKLFATRRLQIVHQKFLQILRVPLPKFTLQFIHLFISSVAPDPSHGTSQMNS